MNTCKQLQLKLTKMQLIKSSKNKISEEYNKIYVKNTKLKQPQKNLLKIANQLAVYFNYFFMIDVSVRLILQAVGLYYSNHRTNFLKDLSAVDGLMTTFNHRYAGNVFLCLSYFPLPLFFVGLHWLLYGRAKKSQVFWQYAYYFVFVNDDNLLFTGKN